MSAWKPEGAPFCWLPKLALERIEQTLEREEAASAKLVYLALARIASIESSAEFTKPIAYIATLASVSHKTVERRLPALEELRLVTVTRNAKMRTQHRYCVATLSPNVGTQSPNVPTASAPKTPPLAVPLSLELKKGGRNALGTAERIGLEKKIGVLKERLADLEGETSEQWQRDLNPKLVQQRQEFRARKAELEDQLLAG